MNKIVMFLVCMGVLLALQAKEKTLDEQLEEAMKNSEKFMQKAGAFQKDFEKQGILQTIPSRPKRCEYIASMPFADALADYTCYAVRDKKWDEVYCRASKSYRNKVENIIKKLKNSSKKYTCKMTNSIEDKLDMTKKRRVFYFAGFGSITVDYIDGWEIVDLDIKE